MRPMRITGHVCSHWSPAPQILSMCHPLLEPLSALNWGNRNPCQGQSRKRLPRWHAFAAVMIEIPPTLGTEVARGPVGRSEDLRVG
jgi:hypothetical protein